MPVILDESGRDLFDEVPGDLLDEAGLPGTEVDAAITCSFRARNAVTAQATMEFDAGQPVQASLVTLASDPWVSMYPG